MGVAFLHLVYMTPTLPLGAFLVIFSLVCVGSPHLITTPKPKNRGPIVVLEFYKPKKQQMLAKVKLVITFGA